MITAILGVFFMGVTDALWRPCILIHGHMKVLLHRTLLTTVLLGLYFISSTSSHQINIPMIGIALLSGLIAGVGLYFLVKAFKTETTTNVLFLNIFTLLISQSVSFILFKEPIVWKYYCIQIGLSIFTVICFNGFNFNLRKGIKYGLLASLCFGIAYPLAGIPIEKIGYQTTIFIQEAIILILFFCIGFYTKKTKIDLKIYYDVKIILLSLLSAIAVILFFYSYTVLQVYKVNLISNFHPIGGMCIAIILFKEHLSKYQILGAISSIIACVLIYII